MPRIGGGLKNEHQAFPMAAAPSEDVLTKSAALVLALVPGRERDEHGRRIGLVAPADEIDTIHDDNVLDRRVSQGSR